MRLKRRALQGDKSQNSLCKRTIINGIMARCGETILNFFSEALHCRSSVSGIAWGRVISLLIWAARVVLRAARAWGAASGEGNNNLGVVQRAAFFEGVHEERHDGQLYNGNLSWKGVVALGLCIGRMRIAAAMAFTGLLRALTVVSRCGPHDGDGSVAWAKVRRAHWARLQSNGGFTGAVALGQMFVYGLDQADGGAQGCDTARRETIPMAI